VEKKQVEGESLFVFCFADFPFEGSPPPPLSDFFLAGNVQACAPR
jgi:hypothetical protein